MLDALLDDLNTPKAFAALHELRGEAAKGVKPAAAGLKASAQLIGCCSCRQSNGAACPAPRACRRRDRRSISRIEARTAARTAKNFNESDRIRDELAAMGIVLKDLKDGTTWEIAR